jgi:hypothetical protein
MGLNKTVGWHGISKLFVGIGHAGTFNLRYYFIPSAMEDGD